MPLKIIHTKSFFSSSNSLPDCAPFTDESAQWHHGAFFVNGFNVGRYHQVGPQKSLYVPGPLLKQGTNEVGSTNVLPHSIQLAFSYRAYTFEIRAADFPLVSTGSKFCRQYSIWHQECI